MVHNHRVPCLGADYYVELGIWAHGHRFFCTVAVVDFIYAPAFCFRSDRSAIANWVAAMLGISADPIGLCRQLYDSYWIDVTGAGCRRNLDQPIGEGLPWVPATDDVDGVMKAIRMATSET